MVARNILVVVAVVLGVGCSEEQQQSVVEEQTFQRQVEEYDAQTRKVAEQLALTDQQLKKSEEQAARMDNLLERWEKQADRYDALLGAWEKQDRK